MLQQLSVFVENRPGALSRLCGVLEDNGIDMRALSLADTQQFGILRMLVPDPGTAKSVLEKAGFTVKTTDVIVLRVADRAGGLAEVMRIIDRHGLSVEYMYAFPSSGDGTAMIVFRFSDTADALEKLSGEKLPIFDPDVPGK
ncbi:MAG: ACT domain-containing protein [Victivallaceae bacterium]|nr:ACT domain-containing protein [Victivallaceae bacterium]